MTVSPLRPLFRFLHRSHVLRICLVWGAVSLGPLLAASDKPRVIVTSDAEIDDQCSLVRFLLYANEWDIEGIITTSSQYRWQGHKWPGDHWIDPYLAAYAQVQPNLAKHDPAYPSYDYLRARTVMGNAGAEGDLAAPSPGSDLIVRVLLDRSDSRPVWLQAWGGVNTIARALKTIEEQHPERRAEVAAKCRLFLIWEQDDTYQRYIRPVWGKYGLLTIISDQFEAIAYRWKQAQPPALHRYFEGAWMRTHILRNRGPLTALYHAHENGDFRSEGDSPAFLHTIPTGLRNMESPDWGGWGGRYVRVRENTWLDPVPVPDYTYPAGRWFGDNGWGRTSLRPTSTSTPEQRERYFRPLWRWTAALQNDFAARAGWCVQAYAEANHPPVVTLTHPHDLTAAAGATLHLSARGTSDPDGHGLTYRWWHDTEAGTASGAAELATPDGPDTVVTLPRGAWPGQTVHVICEVTDHGTPALTRYRRVVVTVTGGPDDAVVHSPGGRGAVAIPPMTAHFPLDEGRGLDITDAAHGLTGRLHNVDPALAWIPGISGGALALDGRSTRAVVPAPTALDFEDGSFSISLWMRWPRGLLPGRQHLLAKGDPTPAGPGESGQRYELFVDSGNLCFSVDDSVAASLLRVPLAPAITGEWVHVAAVRDRKAGRLKLYADGRLLTTDRPGNPAADGTDRSGSVANSHPLILGDSLRTNASYQGAFDDLRFFREALTDGQVAAIAQRVPLVERATEPEPAPAATASLTAAMLPPLTVHFPLTEGEGLAVQDRAGGGPGRLVRVDADTAWTSSDRGLALRLDGVDDRVELPAGPGFDFADESFSLSLHLRWTPGTVAREETLVASVPSTRTTAEGSAEGWEIRMSRTGLRFIVDDSVHRSELQVGSDLFRAATWVHLVAVRDRQEQQLRLYLNGERQAPLLADKDGTHGIDRTGGLRPPATIIIGDTGPGGRAWSGELADLRVYRGILPENQMGAVARLRRNAAVNPAERSNGQRPGPR